MPILYAGSFKMEKHKRRNYLINKSLQLRYVGMIVILMVAVSVGTGWVMYSTTWTMLLDRLKGVTELDKLIIELNKAVLIRTSLLVLASVCLAAVLTVFIVHRVAGPLFRIKRVMHQIARGVVPRRVSFREGDELQDVAMAIDEAVCRIEEVSEKNLKIIKDASACVERAIERLGAPGQPHTRQIEEELERLKKSLGEFEIFQKEPNSGGHNT